MVEFNFPWRFFGKRKCPVLCRSRSVGGLGSGRFGHDLAERSGDQLAMINESFLATTKIGKVLLRFDSAKWQTGSRT